jgi:hypothetical protein
VMSRCQATAPSVHPGGSPSRETGGPPRF